MIRRIGYLIMILAVAFSMIGCTGKKAKDLTPPTNGEKILPEQITDQSTEATADTGAASTDGTGETYLPTPLSRYIHENVTLMGTFAEPAVECDINKDGHPELCTTVTTGSGMVTTLVVVYDVHNDQGYMLNERGKYDYRIMGSSDDVISVEKREFGGDQKTYGTLSIENSELVFCER